MIPSPSSPLSYSYPQVRNPRLRELKKRIGKRRGNIINKNITLFVGRSVVHKAPLAGRLGAEGRGPFLGILGDSVLSAVLKRACFRVLEFPRLKRTWVLGRHIHAYQVAGFKNVEPEFWQHQIAGVTKSAEPLPSLNRGLS